MRRCGKRFPRKLVVLAALLVFVPSGAALASQTWTDAAGDAPAGAPDMTAVALSHTYAGKITFGVTFANRSTLSGDDAVVFVIDSDRNAATGESGIDYLVFVAGEMPNTALVMSATAPDTIAGVAPVMWSKGMKITLAKAVIGSPKAAFDFGVMSTGAISLDDPPTEYVPHADADLLTYSLAVSISKIQLKKPVTSVKAGTVFTIRGATVKLSTGEVFRPTALKGKAVIAGKVLKPLTGGNAWKVPKAAKGKKLVVTMNATLGRMKTTQSLTLRIR